jgi:hypothetical protein
LTPILLNRGVEFLAGLIVRDEDLIWRMIGEGGRRELFNAGAEMVEALEPGNETNWTLIFSNRAQLYSLLPVFT